ncbi:mechanosensitive ion channel [Candidatus Thorarchaeota archaeon]|nr:MAG: mechanosensitive ion channel [Candidatus Thorarchaeota archaeon]
MLNRDGHLQLDFIYDIIDAIQANWAFIYPLLVLLVELVILGVVYAVATRGLTNRLRDSGISREASTGIVLIIRIVFFVVAIVLSVNAFGPDLAALISLSTLFGTALGLAFSQAVSGLVNGVYILVARPFRVGDYVRIGDVEGVVTDITLNYTRILQPDETRIRLPNTNVLSTRVTNFRVPVEDVIQDVTKERLSTDDYSLRRRLTTALYRLRRITSGEIAYRYTFDITLHYTLDHLRSRRHFAVVCDEWDDRFLVTPEFQVWSSDSNGITYRFTIVAEEPSDLIKYVGPLMNELLMVYSEDEDAHEEAPDLPASTAMPHDSTSRSSRKKT